MRNNWILATFVTEHDCCKPFWILIWSIVERRMLLVSKWGGGAPKSPFWAPPAALHSYASRRNLVSPLRWLATLHNRMKVFLKPSFPYSPKYSLWPCVRSPRPFQTDHYRFNPNCSHLIFDTQAPLFRNFTNHGKKDQFWIVTMW